MATVGKVLDVAHRGIAFEAVNVTTPLTAINRLHARNKFTQYLTKIADEGHIHFDVLIDLGGIDFHLEFPGLGRVSLQTASDPVIKAHAEGDQQIGILDHVVHPGFTMHAHHAEIQRMGSRERSEAEQRERHRYAGALRQLANFLHGAGKNDSMSSKDHRPLCFLEQLQCLGVIARKSVTDRADNPAIGAWRLPNRIHRRTVGRPW